jgi:hypothetical protein
MVLKETQRHLCSFKLYKLYIDITNLYNTNQQYAQFSKLIFNF